MTEVYDVNGVPWTDEPWLPYQATKFLESLSLHNVFEWGMGGSTLFLIDECKAIVTSVEHEQQWYDTVMGKVSRYNRYRLEAVCIPPEDGEIGPDKSEPFHYKSGSTALGAVNFKKYVDYIDAMGDLFDLILIDGMARPSCIVHAFPKVKLGGWLVIDNTGDRPYYLEKTAHLFGNYESGWERIDFFGYGPILDYKWRTTFFHNIKKVDYE